MAKRARWLIGLGLVGLFLFGPGLVALLRLSMKERQLDRRLRELQREEVRLRAERQRLESDPTYVEGLIRSTFKHAKPGEYVIPLDAAPSSSESVAGHQESQPHGAP